MESFKSSHITGLTKVRDSRFVCFFLGGGGGGGGGKAEI